MKRKIKSNIKISVSGNRLYSFINALHETGFVCSGQYVESGIFHGEISHRDLRKMTALAKKFGLEIKYFEEETFSSELRQRRHRYGITAGILLLITAFFYFSSVVVTIDVQGCENVRKEDIISALDEIGIHTGTPFYTINYIWSENEIRLMVDGVSWAGMHRSGNKLVVEITEIVEKPEMLNERIPCNIVAAKDAEIVYTSVLDGMLMKKVGDYVYRGEMLVSGVTSDDTGHTVLHHAMGKIEGIYTEKVSFSGEYLTKEFIFTGRKNCRRTLRLFSIDIPLYTGKNEFSYYEKTSDRRNLKIFGKEIPISIKKELLTEKGYQEFMLTEKELTEKISEKIYLYEKNFLSECEIIERKTKMSKTDKGITFDVTYKLRGDICSQKDILIK